MRHRVFPALVGFLAIVTVFFHLPYLAGRPGQFTEEEISRREFQENFLLTAEIVDWKDIGEGVTRPVRLRLHKDGREMRGIWKNPRGMLDGHWEGWNYEIAAYRLDKLLDLNMVPPTVERRFQRRRGSLQFWVDDVQSLLDVMDSGGVMPARAHDLMENGKYLTRAFDSLIANEDRTQQNILFTEDWRTILIDHSRSFRKGKPFEDHLMFGASGIQKADDGFPFLFRRLPRDFVDRLRDLSFENIREAVGSYLTKREIRAVLKRRDLLLKEIQDMIEKEGAAEVLYERQTSR